MSNPPGKYGNVRNFLDNLGNEKIKICRNCNAVFSYTTETTTLCLSCDFEEEISTLPAVVEIEDEFEITEPTVVDAQPTVLDAQPVVAEVDVVEINDDWEMDSFDSTDPDAETVVEEAAEAETIVEETTEVEPVTEAVEAETAVEDTAEAETVVEAVEAESVVEEITEVEPVTELSLIHISEPTRRM